MTLDDIAQRISTLIQELAIQPLTQFVRGLNPSDWAVLAAMLVAAVAVGFAMGRRRSPSTHRVSAYQNSGEALVSRVLLAEFRRPDYHLMNHVTISMDDGTTQVDHILISRFGVFVVETKDYSGWIFANAQQDTWTQVMFRFKFRFQNPIFQNRRHLRAVQGLLDFLPPEAIRSIVVFAGDAEFKTDIPEGVVTIRQLVGYLRQQTAEIMSLNRVQFCVGRLETARLVISGETDVEHAESLARRRGGAIRGYGRRRNQ